MANLASPFTTYSDTTPQKKVITDYISLLDPAETPLLEAIGGLDGAAGKFKFKNKGTNPQWLEDTLSPIDGLLDHAATIASTDTTITVADPNMYQEGHIVLIDSEQVWVSAVSGSVLTVTRAFSGTAATHNSVAATKIVGMARLEGDDSDDIGMTDRTVGSNFTQIFHQEVKVSETQRVIDQYGISDEFDYQSKKAIPSLMRLIERTLIYGDRNSGSGTTPRSMGGLPTFITDNVIDYGSTMAQSHFENAVKSAYEDGGVGPWLAACSPTNLQSVKNFYDSSNFLRITPDQKSVGMVIEEIITPYGNVKLLLDRLMIDDKLPILDVRNVGMLTLRPWTQEPLAKTGDAIKGQVTGEFTLCVKQDKSHAMLTT